MTDATQEVLDLETRRCAAVAAGDLDGAEALWQETATAPPNPA